MRIFLLLVALICLPAQATNVSIITNLGQIDIELFDEKAPKTVENFLAYVDSGFYANTIFHRVIPGFMAQGGGFTVDMDRKETNAPVIYEGENGLSNDRGTIAMARRSDPNSATSQFFINYSYNTNLNHSSRRAGYTVFGKVTAGMEIVDQMATIDTHTVGPYRDVPVTPIIITKIIRQ